MPNQPLKIASLMRRFKPDWFIVGGWAIDLFLGTETRPHEDIEIAVFRKDQLALQKYFSGWNLKKAQCGELLNWRKDEFLELPVHEIHCFNESEEMAILEVLLNESKDGNWLFRRNLSITKPISSLFSTSRHGIRFLRPEVVLLYKSKNPRAKDDMDFNAAVKHLDFQSREWLRKSLLACYSGHHWLRIL